MHHCPSGEAQPMLEVLLTPEALVALITLTLLEIVLGIDNIIFISIVAGRLPAERRPRARNVGLLMAMGLRLLLLLGLGFILELNEPLFHLPFSLPGVHTAEGDVAADIGISGKDLLLLVGGLFLVGKSVSEIHQKMEGEDHGKSKGAVASMGQVIAQIALINLVFSFDSILTAIGLTDIISVMMIAVIVSVLVMMAFSGPISEFIERHPTFQILALSFLILIGFTLIIEALHIHVAKGYVYFAVVFALAVEVVNMRLRPKAKSKPVHLHKRISE